MEEENNKETIDNFSNKVNEYLKNNKVYLIILTPCYGGVCHVDYTRSLIDTFSLLSKYDIKVSLETCSNDSLISRARNNLISKAMLKNPTHMLFIDSDIAWHPHDVLKLIISDKDLVGGIYPKKNFNWDLLKNPDILNEFRKNLDNSVIKSSFNEHDFPQCKLLDYNFVPESTQVKLVNGLIEVKYLATGFMMIKESVIKQMIEHYSQTKYIDNTSCLNKNENNYSYALFDCGVINMQYMLEDWLFCHRFKEIGGNIYADITIDLVHIGTTYFKGTTLSMFF
jgi:hypothetical protein